MHTALVRHHPSGVIVYLPNIKMGCERPMMGEGRGLYTSVMNLRQRHLLFCLQKLVILQTQRLKCCLRLCARVPSALLPGNLAGERDNHVKVSICTAAVALRGLDRADCRAWMPQKCLIACGPEMSHCCMNKYLLETCYKSAPDLDCSAAGQTVASVMGTLNCAHNCVC